MPIRRQPAEEKWFMNLVDFRFAPIFRGVTSHP